MPLTKTCPLSYICRLGGVQLRQKSYITRCDSLLNLSSHGENRILSIPSRIPKIYFFGLHPLPFFTSVTSFCQKISLPVIFQLDNLLLRAWSWFALLHLIASFPITIRQQKVYLEKSKTFYCLGPGLPFFISVTSFLKGFVLKISKKCYL